MKRNVIAIDGSSGSGKTTICRLAARQFRQQGKKAAELSTGFFFRFYAKHPELNILDLDLSMVELKDNKFYLLGYEMDPEDYQDEATGQKASLLSQDAAVRAVVTNVIRLIAKRWNDYLLFMDGRDLTSVMFKDDALVKIYLTADLDVVAARRAKQTKDSDIENIKTQLAQRNKQDRERKLAPLYKTDDAVEINTTADNLIGTVRYVCGLVEQALSAENVQKL